MSRTQCQLLKKTINRLGLWRVATSAFVAKSFVSTTPDIMELDYSALRSLDVL